MIDKAMQKSAATTTPSLEEFARLAAAHTLIPVTRTLIADLETPVSAFLRLAGHPGDHGAVDNDSASPEAFLLESVEGGERVGRYTFIGIEPYQRFTARNQVITHTTAAGSRTFQGDIFAELKRELSAHTPAKLPGLPPFTAGAVGFFAYDIVREIEHLPTRAADELRVPEAHLMFFDQVLAFDHVKKEIHLIVTADLTRAAEQALNTASAASPNPTHPSLASGDHDESSSAHGESSGAHGELVARLYNQTCTRLDRLEQLLARPLPERTPRTPGPLQLLPRTPRADYIRAVDQVKEYVRSGDVFQCVLSQRFDCTPAVDPFEIYRALRIVNPSPYMYFLRFPLDTPSGTPQPPSSRPEAQRREAAVEGPTSPPSTEPSPTLGHIVGSSPELLVRVKNRTVEYRPIAGTRRRDPDEAADRALEANLRADAKEVSEHIMLVDLGRNDLGRVSDFGTVKVKDLMFVERYSHVMHLVSALEATLRPDLSALDAFRSCFPAGTLSGAPKVRAMEIIEELEPARRGVYGGAILYADFSGNLDSCIAIRTLFMHGDHGHIQAGAGIVADSDPESEYEECRNKAQAVVRAIERARSL